MFTADEIYLSVGQKGDERVFKPRADVAEWPLSVPVDWSADPFSDINWQFQLHAWKMTDPVLERFFKTGDKSALEFAAKIACDWWAWSQHDTTAFAWNDMAVGIRALRIGFLLDAIECDALDASYGPRLVELGREHIKRLHDESFIVSGNHGLFQVLGLALLCQVMEREPISKTALSFASEKFKWILGFQFTDEGVHKENSPTYHRFAIKLLRRLKASERFAMPEIESILRRAEEVEPWLVMPNGRWVAVGDSDGPAGKFPALSGGEQHISPDGKKYIVLHKESSGYAVVRSADFDGQSMLFVTGMAHSRTHKHADELSFELFDHGRMIFIDSGKYGYAQDPMRTYIESADAHNTVSLNNRVIGRRDIRLDGTLLNRTLRADGRIIISGSLERPGAFRQTRTITYVPGESLIVADAVCSDEDQQYVSSLHLAPDLEPLPTEDGFNVVVKGRTVRARFVCEESHTIDLARGLLDPRHLGWATSGYLKMEAASVARATVKAHSVSFRWEVDL